MKRRVIAIDGLAGTGKTTLARLLAERLSYLHLNTGALYRAAGLLAARAGSLSAGEMAEPPDGESLGRLVESHELILDTSPDTGGVVVRLDGIALGEELFSQEASVLASRIAAFPQVRTALYSAQRAAFPGKNLVVEGRDMGTVVFPDADLKFFIEVEIEERARRRLEQLRAAGEFPRLEELARDIEERDRRDTERAVAPTVAAPDAIHVRNSGRDLTEITASMYDSAAKRGLV